ncbi:MAG: hypothetical protein GY822_24130 [Deltaproteobacteria bacterium]|nr:hypothetical protein [Deltaproteobacteria bacterium]
MHATCFQPSARVRAKKRLSRRGMPPRAGLLLLWPLLLCAQPVLAGVNDIYLRGLVTENANGSVSLRQDDFKSLTTELGFVLTPSPLQPAETTGQSGFDFALGYSLHGISYDKPYWRDAIEGSLDGKTPFPVMQTLGIRGRKGFILPIPLSSEVELGAQWLVDSNLLNLGGKLRLALNEGFQWIPDFAVEAGVNRLVGSQEIDLTTITAGGSVSKGFGVFGDFNLTPFLSYQAIFINAASRLLVVDPNATADVDANLVNFNRIDAMTFTKYQISGANVYHRVSGGLRVHVAIISLYVGVDANLTPENVEKPVFYSVAARAGLLF